MAWPLERRFQMPTPVGKNPATIAIGTVILLRRLDDRPRAKYRLTLVALFAIDNLLIN